MDLRFEQVDRRFKQVDKRFEQVDKRFDLIDQKMDIQFRAIMAAIAESKAQVGLNHTRLIAALSERVALLDAQRRKGVVAVTGKYRSLSLTSFVKFPHAYQHASEACCVHALAV